ncbi:MAG: TIGR01906 family membrane protein [Chloroflexi bacterium]|nr:TIGR01906 family membrane protein [Chloroflexota bacterium]
MEQSTWLKIIRFAIIIAMPFFLGLGMILMVINWNSPTYPEWEYGRIPPDQFGFNPEERLDLAQKTLRYLRHPGQAKDVITLLEELQISDTGEPLYNPAEIGHMLDVKNVTDNIRFVWLVSMIVVVVSSLVLLVKPETAVTGWRTIMFGGIFTVIVLLAIALFILLAWDIFFVQFHELLFPPGSWTFAYSDGLIRLFPEQFWFDIGVIMSGGALLMGGVTAVLGYLMARRG